MKGETTISAVRETIQRRIEDLDRAIQVLPPGALKEDVKRLFSKLCADVTKLLDHADRSGRG